MRQLNEVLKKCNFVRPIREIWGTPSHEGLNSWICTRIFDMMLFFFLHCLRIDMMSIFASSVCKSFRVSSIVDSDYRFILLLYHHHFGSNSQTVPRKYPHRIDLHQDDVFFWARCQKFASSYRKRCKIITTSLFFWPHPGQKVDLH